MTNVDNKKIAKNTIYLYIRMIISLLISLYTSRAVLDALGVVDYGVYNVVAGFVTLLSVFTSTITSATQRFITFSLGKGDLKELADVFSVFLSLMIVISIAVLVFGETIGLLLLKKYLVIPDDRQQIAFIVYHCSLLSFIVNLISIPYVSSVIAHEDMNFYAIVNILESVLRLLIVWVIYITPVDRLMTYAVLLVFVGLQIRIIYGLYCKRRYKEISGKLSLKKEIVKDVASYSGWTMIGASSAILKEQGVNVVINMFYGVIMNTARGIGVIIMGLLGQFSGSIGQAIAPQITKSYAEGKVNRAITLTFLLTKCQGILTFLIALPIFMETEFVLNLWLKDVPKFAVLFTRWSIILAIARTFENTHGPLFLATGKVRNLQIVGGGIMLLNLPLSYYALYMGCPIESTMLIGIIIEAVVMLIAYLYLNKIVGFPINLYYKKVIIPFVLVFILSSIIPGYLRFSIMEEGILRMIFVCVFSFVITIFLSYMLVLSSNERKMVIHYLSSKVSHYAKSH